MKLSRTLAIPIAGIALSVFLCATPSLSRAATGLSIQPTKLDQTMNPGSSYTGTLQLGNASDGPIDVEVIVDDFVPVAGAQSIQFVNRAPGVTSVRDWVTVQGPQKFSLALKQSKEITYSLAVPTNAEPGSHFGVLFFKATPKGGATGTLKVGTQVGMLVLITIPGNHLEKGQILDFFTPSFLQGPPVPFSVKFQNTGTVHFEPKGDIAITNIFGSPVARVPVTGEVILPTSIKTLRYDWNPSGHFLIGWYTAVATIYDGDGNALTSKTIGFWILPVWYILSFLVALVFIYFLLRYLKRHVRVSMR